MELEKQIEDVEKEITTLKNYSFSKFYDIDFLSQSRKELIKNSVALSFAIIIYTAIQWMVLEINKLYKDPEFKHISVHRNLYQYESDEIYEICIKANKLGLKLYPLPNPNGDLSYLDEEERTKLLEIYQEAFNKYFEIMLKYNVEYLNDENGFINKMLKFGEIHDLNETDLVTFAENALKLGYNVSNIDTLEELDEIYKKVFPEV